MTPVQLRLLDAEHRESLIHAEMCAGFTSAAIANYSFAPPEKPVSALRFMPNHPQYDSPDTGDDPEQQMTPEQQEIDLEMELLIRKLRIQLTATITTDVEAEPTPEPTP